VYALAKGLYGIGTLALVGALLAWTLVGRRATVTGELAQPQAADTATGPAPAIEGSAGAAAPETVAA
jgi:hypothetical protein